MKLVGKNAIQKGHKDLRRLCGCFVKGRGGNDWKQREQVEKQGGRRWVQIRELPLSHCRDGRLRMTDMERSAWYTLQQTIVCCRQQEEQTSRTRTGKATATVQAAEKVMGCGIQSPCTDTGFFFLIDSMDGCMKGFIDAN